MEITFYYAPMSSAVPVASALEELGLAHRRVTFDLANGDQRQPDFLQLNPNGKVPTLVIDGAPLFESTAIVQWLGSTFGVDKGLWPKPGTPECLAAHAWSTWALVEYGAVMHQLYLATHDMAPAELKNETWANHARSEAQKLLGILDGQLAKGGFVCGDRYSLADVIVSGMVMWGRFVGAPTADHPHVSQWIEACEARPAIKKEWGL